MTDDSELRTALELIFRSHAESALAVLGMQAHLDALKATLFALDSRAAPLFERELSAAQDKHQQQIEELRRMLAQVHSKVSKLVH
jgi:hypothetical protein